MAGQAAFDSIFGKAVTSYVADKEKVDSDETKNDEKMKVKLYNINGLDVTEEEESAAELKPEPQSLWNILQESTKAATVFEAPGSSQSVPEPAAGHVPDQEEDPRAGIPPSHLTTNEDFANEDNAIKVDQPTGEQLEETHGSHGHSHITDVDTMAHDSWNVAQSGQPFVRGECISLGSVVAHFGSQQANWEKSVKEMIQSLTTVESEKLMKDSKQHPKLKEYEYEVGCCDVGEKFQFGNGLHPDDDCETELESLITWLVFNGHSDNKDFDFANKWKADGPADEALAEDQPQQEQAEPVPDQEEDPRAGMPPVHLTTSTFARRKRPKTAEVAQLRWDVLRAAFVHEIKPLLTSPSAHEDC